MSLSTCHIAHLDVQVRTMTFEFGFCLVLYGVGISLGSCTSFTFRFGSWENLVSSSGSFHSCWVRVLSSLL